MTFLVRMMENFSAHAEKNKKNRSLHLDISSMCTNFREILMKINCCRTNHVFQLFRLRNIFSRVLVAACENEVDILDQEVREYIYTNFRQIWWWWRIVVFFSHRIVVFFRSRIVVFFRYVRYRVCISPESKVTKEHRFRASRHGLTE